jgi:hypothetical protein
MVRVLPVSSLRSAWLLGTAFFLSSAPLALAQTVSGVGVGTPISVWGVCSGSGAAGEAAMISGFNTTVQEIEQAGAMLSAGQSAQSQADAQIFQQVDTTYANATRQAAVAQMESNVLGAQPVDQNGSSIRDDCGMTGTNGGALGLDAGNLARAGYSTGLLTALTNADAGAQGTSAYVSALATTQIDPATVIGGPGGTGTSSSGSGTYSPENTAIAIQQLTDPIPMTPLPSGIKSAPAATRYAALQNVAQSQLGLAQETLTGVSALNAPIYPLQSWAQTQITTATSGNSALQSQATSALNAASNNGAISDNTILATLDEIKFANPTWWQTIATTPSSQYLLQQIAETDAIDLDVGYQTLLLKERIDTLLAIQSANSTNASITAQADQLRSDAITQSASSAAGASTP